MKELVVLTVVSALIGLLVPGGQDSGVRKAVSFLCGLILLYSIASFVFESLEGLREFPQYLADLLIPDVKDMEIYESQGEEWIVEYSVENIEAGVSALVENRYGFPAGSVRTEAFTEKDTNGNILLTHLTVYVKSRGVLYGPEIANYVADILSCPCDVVITE